MMLTQFFYGIYRPQYLKWHVEAEAKWLYVPKDPINNIPALDQIMALHRPVDKPLP